MSPFDPFENFLEPGPPAQVISVRPPMQAISRANTDSRLPLMHISSLALAKLRWSAEKNENEFTFWGLIDVDQATGGFIMKDAILAKHTSNPVYCDPDMEWFADLLMDKFSDDGIQPWQLACWIHTHPPGMDSPSGPDVDTFTRNLGDQRLSLMVIMTKDLKFWGRMSALVEPFAGVTAKTYSASPLRFTFEDPNAQVTAEMAAALDAAYPSLWDEYIPPARATSLVHSSLITSLGKDEEEGMDWSGLTRYFRDDEEVEEEEPNYLIYDYHEDIAFTRAEVLNYLAYFSEVDANGTLVFDEARAYDLENVADGLLEQNVYGPTVAQAVLVRHHLRQLAVNPEIIKEVKNALSGGQ